MSTTTYWKRISSITPNDAYSLLTVDSYYSNGHHGRISGIGYDGERPYLVIDGNKHHFNIVD